MLNALFSAPTLAGAHVGALVVDAGSGRVLYARDADDAFVPASTMKLIVGSAALDDLGPAFTFVTTVATDGSTLYVRGGGDVLLQEAQINEAASTLRSLALHAFPGGLAGDNTRYTGSRYPAGWQVDDLPYDYAAPVSALAFSDNALHLTVAPAAPGQTATLSVMPDSDVERIRDDVITGAQRSEDTTDLSYRWGRPYTIDAIGAIPAGSSTTLDAAMLAPARVTLDLFARAFAAAGISFGNGGERLATMPSSARVLWQHDSPELPQLLASMWLPSDNLLAETLLQELGVGQPGAEDTRTRGIARERMWLRGIGVDPNTLTIADGSGMSAYDRVTPRALVAILAHDWNGPSRAVVLHALPIAGERGTLKHRFVHSPLVGTLIAKTGTVNHTRTLAGYLKTPHGTRIFALMINDWIDTRPGAEARIHAFQRRFLERIRNASPGVP